jgi:hypothetical protein
VKIVTGYPRVPKPIRPAPRGPHEFKFSQGATVLLIIEHGALNRYFLEEFPNAWHPHRLPNG